MGNKEVAKKIFLMAMVVLMIFLIIVLVILAVDLVKYQKGVNDLIKEKNATCQIAKEKFGIPIVKFCSYQEITNCTINGSPINCSELNLSVEDHGEKPSAERIN